MTSRLRRIPEIVFGGSGLAPSPLPPSSPFSPFLRFLFLSSRPPITSPREHQPTYFVKMTISRSKA